MQHCNTAVSTVNNPERLVFILYPHYLQGAVLCVFLKCRGFIWFVCLFSHKRAIFFTPIHFNRMSHSALILHYNRQLVIIYKPYKGCPIVNDLQFILSTLHFKQHCQLFCYAFPSTGGHQSAGAHDQRPSKLCETGCPHCLCPHHDPADRSHLSQGKC